MTSESGLPERSAPARSRTRASSSARRLARPVSGSVRARLSSRPMRSARSTTTVAWAAKSSRGDRAVDPFVEEQIADERRRTAGEDVRGQRALRVERDAARQIGLARGAGRDQETLVRTQLEEEREIGIGQLSGGSADGLAAIG